jgi:endoglucanase
MNRRRFLESTGAAVAAGLLTHSSSAQATAKAENPAPAARWRGFNLLELFSTHRPLEYFKEQDFELMAEWGFNFARIPMSYWFWSKPEQAKWMTIDEKPMRVIDDVITQGKRYGVHINLNLHRIPGYCINGRELEPMDLFEGPESRRAQALEAACHHWRFFAKRFKGIPSSELSFDLINEPPSMPSADYAVVARALITAIREEDPARLIVSDGIDVGRRPVPELAELGVMQSGRGYDPIRVSHYLAGWIPEEARGGHPLPTWPLKLENGESWDKETLRQRCIRPWKEIEAKGVRIHIGEWGSYHKTPHAVSLAWMRDLLDLWKEAGWGWALWNLRGDFGPLDSTRADVKYETCKGHTLDRAMLELLRAG